jgi:hypothetical protein
MLKTLLEHLKRDRGIILFQLPFYFIPLSRKGMHILLAKLHLEYIARKLKVSCLPPRGGDPWKAQLSRERGGIKSSEAASIFCFLANPTNPLSLE